MTTNADFDYDTATAPPGAVFVSADEPLLVYPSVAAAQRNLEAIDVRNSVYAAPYGLNGQPYRIGNNGNHVVIELTGEPNRPDELRSLLVRYLDAIGRPPDATATNGDLVATVWAIERDFWQEHDPYGDRFGTRVPLWECIAFVALVVAVLYSVSR